MKVFVVLYEGPDGSKCKPEAYSTKARAMAVARRFIRRMGAEWVTHVYTVEVEE